MPVFDPTAYGCPSVKPRAKASPGNRQQSTQNQTQLSHSTWILTPHNRPQHQSTKAAESVRGDSARQSETNKQSTAFHRPESSSCISAEPENLSINSQDMTKPNMPTQGQASTGGVLPSNTQTTIFNPYAYGDPTAKRLSRQNHTSSSNTQTISFDPYAYGDPTAKLSNQNHTSSSNTKTTGFDPYAYGDPTAKLSSQARAPARTPSPPSGPAKAGSPSTSKPGIAGSAGPKGAAASDMSPKIKEIMSSRDVTPCVPTRAIIERKEHPIVNVMGSQPEAAKLLNDQASAKEQQVQSKAAFKQPDHVASSPENGRVKNASARKEKVGDNKPAPATYETLKMPGESPEQVIARLQKAGLREVGLRLRRQDKGQPVTTALTVLDFLRKPLPPSEVEHSELPPTEACPSSERTCNGDIRQSQRSSVLTGGQKVPRNQNSGQGDGKDWLQAGANGVKISRPHGKENAETLVPAKQNIRGWPTAAERKPPSIQLDTNAEGPELDSDTDSLRPMGGDFGRLNRNRDPAIAESSLRGWDGNMQPPPLEWESRPRFSHNTPEYLTGFDRWLAEVAKHTLLQNMSAARKAGKDQPPTNIGFKIFPRESICNPNNHADGIGFVNHQETVDPADPELFPKRLPGEVLIGPRYPTDFAGDAKLDLRDDDNRRYKEETAQMFIDKQMVYIERKKKEARAQQLLHQQQQEQAQEQEQAQAQEQHRGPAAEEPDPPKPERKPTPVESNIYLRPAVPVDFPGMARIYNWYISHGIRPSDLRDVTEQDMAVRHQMCESARLPVIVAVERNRKNVRRKPPRRRVNPNHSIQNTNPNYNVVKNENVVGWASATDWSAKDFLETTTAEVELYVAPGFRKQGIGRCLMDALLDATDGGYTAKRGYDFLVSPELQNLYTCGGGRQLYKLIFQVRSFNRPYTPAEVYRMDHAGRVVKDWAELYADEPEEGEDPAASIDCSKEAKLNDREDDYTVWLKEWLESFGFEEEAWLKKIGAKNKRYVDVRYLTRDAATQPVDRKVPDWSSGY